MDYHRWLRAVKRMHYRMEFLIAMNQGIYAHGKPIL